MRRRTFLGLLGALAAGAAGGTTLRPASAAVDRLTVWDPAASSPFPPNFVALEWRYLAGRIAAGGEDFGFVVSLADYNEQPLLGFTGRNELLVMKEDFAGGDAHRTRTYPGTLRYDAATATYSFVASDDPAVTANWRLDTRAQGYTLSVASPELALTDLSITPAGNLIPEGGTGLVSSGDFSFNGQRVVVLSDYYADWVTIRRDGAPAGTGRLDMQTLRPNIGVGAAPDTYSHHWFAVAATLEDSTPAWISGWQILTGSNAAWGVTVATGAGASWAVRSVGSDSGFGGRQPLEVQILEYQPVPGASAARRTGKRWRLRAGQAAPGDLIDLDVAVPPGQFITSTRVAALNLSMQESVAPGARGMIDGKGITASSLAVVESTFAEDGAPAPVRHSIRLPLVRS
jgi:hypothetical protein